MIKLDVQPYCEDCLMFEADVEKPARMYGCDGIREAAIIQTDTVVRCSRRKLCEGLKRHLEKETRGENCDA